MNLNWDSGSTIVPASCEITLLGCHFEQDINHSQTFSEFEIFKMFFCKNNNTFNEMILESA